MVVSKIKTFLKNKVIEKIQYAKYKYIFKMHIDKTTKISRKAILDTTNPKGVHIGAYTMITANGAVLTHDFVNQIHKSTFIGSNCFIGMNSIILAGVNIGDNVIIGAGSVVNKDIPDNCLAAGNPVKIIETDIRTQEYGVLLSRGNKTKTSMKEQND